MGTFRTGVDIENPAAPGERRHVANVLVDTGAELSWFPAAVLESRVDPVRTILVDAGPAPAAVAA